MALPMKPRTPNLRIGDIVQACEDGRLAGQKGKPCRAPGWTTRSPTLLMAFHEGYEGARRREGVRDGTAR